MDNFISFSDVWEFDRTTENGLMYFDNPKENPRPEFKFYVRVGGGYRGFQTKREAKKYYNEDY